MGHSADLARICDEFQVAILYVFGSRAAEISAWLIDDSSKLAPGPSDVDLGAKAMRGVEWSVRDKVQLGQTLEELLGVHRVDLIVLDRANPFLAEEVIRGERLYARDEYEADEYDLYVLRRAGDLAPLERERFALVKEYFT